MWSDLCWYDVRFTSSLLFICSFRRLARQQLKFTTQELAEGLVYPGYKYSNHITGEPKALPFSLLEKITKNFDYKEEIGRGGFAVVYKGELANGYVAVKRLSNTYMYENEFQREVECLMKVKHKNIVRFLGYCSDTQGNMQRHNGKFVMADVQERLLCFEYLPKGSLDAYIQDASSGLEWRVRYRIIKGICEGLHSLHDKNIWHLDLKPSNILMHDNMIPKITDFGLSRSLEDLQTRVVATKMIGTRGYLAPEFTSHIITHKFDLYSLGIIITEILTGQKECQAIESILERWGKRLELSHESPHLEQIRVCAEIAIECTNFDPSDRPADMKHVMARLAEIESTEEIKMLEVLPSLLWFPCEVTSCASLHLANNTDKYMAFRIMDKSPEHWVSLELSTYGVVPPTSSYTLVMMSKIYYHYQLKPENIYLILESTPLEGQHVQISQTQYTDTFFEKVKEINEVQEVKLNVFVTPWVERTQIMSSKPISPEIKIFQMENSRERWRSSQLYSLDTNQGKQWIITGGSSGCVGIWNYETQRKVDSFKLSVDRAVTCVKFIPRKQWFVAATERGDIYIYSYGLKMEKTTIISAGYEHGCVVSLAVHPTKTYLLTVSGQQIKLWDWDKGWECTQISTGRSYTKIFQVAFNPTGTLAIASNENEVEIWSLDSPKHDYTLFSGHSDVVNCIEFFTSGDHEYLVSGSDDHTAKIWDMELKVCACTLEASASPVLSAIYQPDLQILITGSKDGLIYLWSTTHSRICWRSPRLERIIDLKYGGAVRSLACVMGRLVIGKEDALAVANIDAENKNYQEESTDYRDALLTTSTGVGDTTSRVIVGSSDLLDVYPLELLFHREAHNMRSLRLTNKTDKHVAFRIINMSGKSHWYECFVNVPLYGAVPPGSTSHLIVTMKQEMNYRNEMDLVLQSSMPGDKNAVLLASETECSEFFKEANELGHAVHELALKFIYTPIPKETMFEPVIPLRMKIISLKKCPSCIRCLDAHPTQPWIITGHDYGYVRIWNSSSQELAHTFNVSRDEVDCVKFDPNKHWIVAATSDGLIHVYDCIYITRIKKIASFGAHVDKYSHYCKSIAIHPIKPYVLLSSKSSTELWDEDKGWKCTRTFGSGSICQAFNPEDLKSFATVSDYVCVKVWSLDSSDSNYEMSGNSEAVSCLAYFTRGDQQYLITGSYDCTAKIWELQKKTCIHTMEGFMSPVIHVLSLPNRPYIVTCSANATIHVWSSIDFRLKTTVNFSGGGKVYGISCFMGSRRSLRWKQQKNLRIALGQWDAISILDIDVEEEEGEDASNNEANNEDSPCRTG
uniref:Uncharacterized protein n=1 Tax=Avena sativa TaxID=4498 RepID=A0ACD5W474_AVESA